MPKWQEIRDLNLPGTPWATSACRGRPLLYLYVYNLMTPLSNIEVFTARKFIVLFNEDSVLAKKPPLHAAMFRSFRHCPVFCTQFLCLCCDGTAVQITLTISSHHHNRDEVRSSTWRILSLRTNRVVENTQLLLPGRTESTSGKT